MADDETRDRVRALVRDVLSKAMPAESEAPSSHIPSSLTSLPSPRPTVTRDESAKLVITEDDVRGLERGAVLSIAENAKLTPLAADIVNDRGIEIGRRVPRSGWKQQKTIAGEADDRGFSMSEVLQARLTALGRRVHAFGTDSKS